jgi:hypothetical protein
MFIRIEQAFIIISFFSLVDLNLAFVDSYAVNRDLISPLSIFSLIDRSMAFLDSYAQNNVNGAHEGTESCESTPAHRGTAGLTDSPYFRQVPRFLTSSVQDP